MIRDLPLHCSTRIDRNEYMYTEAFNFVAASIIAILDVMLVCTDDMAFRVL